MRTKICALLLWTSCALGQPTAWRVDTIAGIWPLGNDGPATNALLGRPRHLTYDRAGNLYIADTDNHQIRRVDRTGRIVAVVGSGIQGDGGDGGPALAASLNQPRAVAFDFDGNRLYIADSGNCRIRVVNLETGVIEPFAGVCGPGSAGDGGPAAQARFRFISCIIVDPQGNLLISDSADDRIRRINRQTGVITTVVRPTLIADGFNGSYTFPLDDPEGLAVEADGTFYVASTHNSSILRVDPGGRIRYIVRASGRRVNPVALALDPVKRVLYFTDALQCAVGSINLATEAVQILAGNQRCSSPGDGSIGSGGLAEPGGIAFDGANLVVSDTAVGRIRRLNAAGNLESLVGRLPFAGDGGPAREAILSRPGMAIPDGAGGYLVADTGNCVIRRVSARGSISTFAGQPGVCRSPNTDFAGSLEAVFTDPVALARDRRGNVYVSEGSRVRRIAAEDSRMTLLSTGLRDAAGIALDPAEENLYVAEKESNRILRISLGNRPTTSVLAGTDDYLAIFGGDGGPAAKARFYRPSDIAVDRNGNIFIADTGNQRIRRIDSANDIVSTVVGRMTAPTSIAIDSDGSMYVTSSNRIVRISGQSPQPEVLAGSPAASFAGDGGPGALARFSAPASVRLDGRNLIVADQGNNRIRSLTPLGPAALSLISGNNQSAAVRTAVSNPLVVGVHLTDGTPVPGATVTFDPTAGTLDPERGVVVTDRDGNASARLIMPAGAGRVTVTATVTGFPVTGLSQVVFTLTALPAVVVTPPRINAVITAGAFGAAPRIAPGSWIELYGTGFTTETREWSPGDFTGATAPTTLGGVRVLINERPAFLQRISPGQINAVAPDGIGAGRVPVQVINAAGNSETFFVEAAPRAPALLAVGSQYAVAMLPDGTFAGTAARPARPGDRLVLYGIGFGATAPSIPAGQIASQPGILPNLRVTLGGVEARVDYGGLANGFVGLYQLNIVVPAMPAGSAALAVSVDGTPLTQALVVAVGE